MTIPKITQLKNMTDNELILEYDKRAINTVAGTSFYLDELRYREAERQSRKIVRMTIAMTLLTVVITFATIINVIVFLNDSPTVPGFIQ